MMTNDINKNIYADKVFDSKEIRNEETFEALVIADKTTKCLVHRKPYAEITYKTVVNGITFGVASEYCPECRRLFIRESAIEKTERILKQAGTKFCLYDRETSLAYLKSQIKPKQIKESTVIYVPDSWIEENPICPIHKTELEEIPCKIKYVTKELAFDAWYCETCEKLLLRKSSAFDLEDKCSDEGMPAPEFERLKLQDSKKRKALTKIKPDFYIDNGKIHKYSRNPSYPFLTPEEIVVISDISECDLLGHDTDDILINVNGFKRDGGMSHYLCGLGYCVQCSKYYMNIDDYKALSTVAHPEISVIFDIDDESETIVSGEVFKEEKNHLASVEKDLEKMESDIKGPEFVGKYSVDSDIDGRVSQQYIKERLESRGIYKELERIGELQNKPYSYRVDITGKDNTEIFYLGANDIKLKDKTIISYNSDFGRELVHYRTTEIKYKNKKYNLQLLREFDIAKARLFGYKNLRTDEDLVFREGITDPFLIKVLKTRKRQRNLTDIMVTVQKNQNAIIDAPLRKNIIVQGCAGSGKTMVMLHRLSSLLYKNKTIDNSEVLILTPNDNFNLHIKGVVESLQISGIRRMSMEQYFRNLVEEYDERFGPGKARINDENRLNSQYVDYVYSDEYADSLVSLYKDAVRSLEDSDNELCLFYETETGLTDGRDEKYGKDTLTHSQRLLSHMKSIAMERKTAIDNAQRTLSNLKEKKEELEEDILEFEISFEETIPMLYTVADKLLKGVVEEETAINKIKSRLEENRRRLQTEYDTLGNQIRDLYLIIIENKKAEAREIAINLEKSLLLSENKIANMIAKKSSLESEAAHISNKLNSTDTELQHFESVKKNVIEFLNEESVLTEEANKLLSLTTRLKENTDGSTLYKLIVDDCISMGLTNPNHANTIYQLKLDCQSCYVKEINKAKQNTHEAKAKIDEELITANNNLEANTNELKKRSSVILPFLRNKHRIEELESQIKIEQDKVQLLMKERDKFSEFAAIIVPEDISEVTYSDIMNKYHETECPEIIKSPETENAEKKLVAAYSEWAEDVQATALDNYSRISDSIMEVQKKTVLALDECIQNDGNLATIDEKVQKLEALINEDSLHKIPALSQKLNSLKLSLEELDIAITEEHEALESCNEKLSRIAPVIDFNVNIANPLQSLEDCIGICNNIPDIKLESGLMNHIYRLQAEYDDDLQIKEYNSETAEDPELIPDESQYDEQISNLIFDIEKTQDEIFFCYASVESEREKEASLLNKKSKIEILLNHKIDSLSAEEKFVWLTEITEQLPEIKKTIPEFPTNENQYAKKFEENKSLSEKITDAENKYEDCVKNDFSDSAKDYLAKMDEQLKQYDLSTLHGNLLRDATASVSEHYRNSKNIKEYRFTLYSKLLLLTRCLGFSVDPYKIICIDEGQDLSLNEYELIRTLNPKAVINIYGDTRQLLKPGRGIGSWELLISRLKAEQYILNENYRNTNQITSFCNDSFSMDMVKTGVDGPTVREIIRRDLEKELTEMKLVDERVAILIPKISDKENYIDKAQLSADMISSIKNTIGPGLISVMYVDEVKGVEFDKVFVVQNGMNMNERYVAYTRALTELIVVVDNTI